MPWYLGIDTSNYTTSCAAYHPESGEMLQSKKPLQVKEGGLGLRQSDAVFLHVKQLEVVCAELLEKIPSPAAVGVSVRPRDTQGSYMPCFLTGEMAAGVIAAALGIPRYTFSHQAGHIAAALYATGRGSLFSRDFLAFHVSGGTTECVYCAPAPDKPFLTEILSQSRDLFAGQAVDRVGAMLGLGFPAGPALELLAKESGRSFKAKPAFRDGDPCLSGVENQCRAMLERGERPADVAAYCLAYLEAALAEMTRRAREAYPDLPVVYAGGVMSNAIIQNGLKKHFDNCFFAPPAFSADNAAGIAVLCARSSS